MLTEDAEPTTDPPLWCERISRSRRLCRPNFAPAGRRSDARRRIKLYNLIDEADRIADWLYLPETLYAFMLIMVVSAGAGPCSLDVLIRSLMNKHVA